MLAATMTPEDVVRIERTLFFEPPQMRSRLVRFGMLILFASVIATGGLLSDSVASVIGAMIVAPLMTPIMGMVVAVVIGSGSRFARSAIIVLAGIVLSIAVGWLMATFMPHGWDPTTSDQIMDRTSPRLLDLVIALASGGAGAYALSRVDVADALPGVAIAISLVPPLNTTGVLLAAGYGDLATGAFVLFLANMGAILLAGTIAFIATGLATAVGRRAGEARSALIGILVFVAIIIIPLRANSTYLWLEATREEEALAIVRDWLEPTDWDIYEIRVDGDEVTILIGGEGELPPAEDAVQKVMDTIQDDITIVVRMVNVHERTIETTPSPGD